MDNITTNDISDFIFYTGENGNIKLEVFLKDGTIWLTQKKISELFEISIKTVNEHLINIFKSEELEEKSVIRKFRITADDGKNYNTNFYNLDAVISVGYRVNSKRATQFRVWATAILKEYMKKGFVLDDARLKQGTDVFGKDYFQELLDRVRSIRASERRLWLKVTDIFAECSIDYDPKSETTRDFYGMIQNKFHYAITEQTAAEIIYLKANREEPNMGLSTWKHSPKGRILKTDVLIAKNYLKEAEIKELERTVSSFFDYIERLISKRTKFTMIDFSKSIDNFLNFNEYKILENKGHISKEAAEEKAIAEYKEFNKTQPIDSDFEKEIKKMLENHST